MRQMIPSLARHQFLCRWGPPLHLLHNFRQRQEQQQLLKHQAALVKRLQHHQQQKQ
jgi:hypothetical protein